MDTYSHLGAFAATLTSTELAQVRTDPDVAFVQENGTVSVQATQDGATWGLGRIDQASLPLSGTYEYDATGAGVTAYIIDTGISAGHSDFGGRVGGGYDAVGDGNGTNDCNGHGTHVAGTVGGATYGVAKGVDLVPVRVLDCDGSGTDTGVTVAVAAGNETADACGSSPARAASAITVAASNSSDEASYFSNYGSCVDLYAPGEDITSDWIGSSSATNTISGTSMASPHVTGAAALYLEKNPGASPAQVTDGLLGAATSGVISGTNGSPNLLLSTGF